MGTQNISYLVPGGSNTKRITFPSTTWELTYATQCTGMSIYQYWYTTLHTTVPSHFSFGSTLVVYSAGSPYIDVTKLSTYTPAGIQEYSAKVTLMTQVWVRDSGGATSYYPTSGTFTNVFTLTLRDDGCGNVTF
jgi:hypothetical protein